jgi:Asp-tRNA(Asn)/Glu-tRNA(Gln) amidotransferase C subunit
MLAWQGLGRTSIRTAASLPSRKCSASTLRPVFGFFRYNSTKELDDLSALLQKPSWSVRSLLPSSNTRDDAPQVTRKQLHHLLRLSALPLPSSAEEEAKMLETLDSQLHFVKEIQQVDTAGVAPLRALRDETQASDREQTITLGTLEEALSKEQVVGKHYKRIKRTPRTTDAKVPSEDWDPLPQAQNRAGSYFVVENEKT